MTVGESILDAVQRLSRAGIESPQVDAEWLLAEILSCSRSEVLLRAEAIISAGQLERLNKQLKRRSSREPLQHILGVVGFFGYEFRVSPAALIPRPETETLVELVLDLLTPFPSPVILDLGTGSGCVAISIAKRCPCANVIASDCSYPALQLAQQNAESLDVLSQIDFREADGLTSLAKGEQMDLIISNPPYIPTREIAGLQPEVRYHDPHLALDGGGDGLMFYRMLAARARHHLKQGGKLVAEFGDNQEQDVEELFRQAGWPRVEIACDLSGRPRIVIASPTQ